MSDDRDRRFMEECFELALKAEGRTAPNPIVGSVVLDKEGQVAGRGFHARAGQAHAEVVALDQAGERAVGGTLYASLEPCCHQGKTPACSARVIASGVTRVVFAQEDPNPKVSGGGSAQLTAAGIKVESGLLEEKAEWINRGFLKRMRSGLPWLCLKIAASLDGKIADGAGNSRWVTGAASLQYVHQLRDKFDAVLVGSNTLQQDDPELTVREVVGRDPVRIAIDRKLMVGSESRFMNTQTDARTLILCGTGAPLDRCAAMPDGCECVIVPEHVDGQLMLKQALQKIGEEGINTVLCEGGGKLAGSLLREGLVDEVYWVVAPVVLGELGRPSVDLAGKVVAIGDAQRFERLDSFVLGDDQWLHLKVQR